MVTLRTPGNRVVSMRATTAVASPGARSVLRAVAVVQPHETRTLLIRTGPRVLLVTRKGWVRAGPRGTDPKSRDNSSNSASAQVPAAAGAAATRPARTTRQYRNMGFTFPAARPPGPPGATRRGRHGPSGGPPFLFHRP